jgi:hypothetical protein
LAALIPFNNIDKNSQIVSQLRASRDFSLSLLQQIGVLSHYVQKTNIKPKYPFSEENDLTPSKVKPNTFSPPIMSLVMETVPIRSDSVHYITVSNVVRSGTTQYAIVLDANHFELIYPSIVQFGKILNTIHVPLTVPLAFVQRLKPSKHNNTHFKNNT